jgi:Zn-dependent membrane protease YugP
VLGHQAALLLRRLGLDKPLPATILCQSQAPDILTPFCHQAIAEQIAGVQKVLGAAAWTYVAAAVSAIGVWLFYLFALFFRGRSASARM